MSKEDLLEQIKLLSALESWSFTVAGEHRLPDYLQENLDIVMGKLEKELLK